MPPGGVTSGVDHQIRFAGSAGLTGSTLPSVRADPGLNRGGAGHGPLRAAGGLVRACHPLPCLAVTACGTAYAIASGLPPARTVLLAAAAMAGQLGVGWTNERVRRPDDREARPGVEGRSVRRRHRLLEEHQRPGRNR